MSVLSSRPALRWALPAGVLAVAVATASGGTILAANAKPTLPSKTAAQLLVDLQNAKVDGLSGTVVLKTDLGLPALPNIGGQGSSNLTSMISGAHSLRVWSSGETKARLALLGTLGESDVIRNGKDVWMWSSEENSATHYTLPDNLANRNVKPKDLPADLPKTPQEAADKALAAIDPTTKVSTDGAARVAGRDAYELVITPKDTASKIGAIRLAIDAEKKIPLRVRIFGHDTTAPAVEVGFTQVTLAKPADSNFKFTPPPGVKVNDHKGAAPEIPAAGIRKAAGGEFKPTVVGTGWTSVVVIKNAPLTAAEKASGKGVGQLDAVLGQLPKVSGSWGSGRVLDSKLFSVLILDDGRILAGAVTKDKLIAAAGDPAAAVKAPR